MQGSNNKGSVQFDCKYHKGFMPYFINLNAQQEGQSLICMMCLEQQQKNKFQLNSLQPIETILRSLKETILPKWPPLQNQNILCEIEESLTIDHSQDTLCQVVVKYFDDFKLEINKCIDQICQETLEKCYQMTPNCQEREQVISIYNSLAEKEKIKSILTGDQIGYDEAQSKISEIVKQKDSEKQQNENMLLDLLISYKNNQQKFDQIQPNLNKQEILKLIQSIDFFPKSVKSCTDVPQNCFIKSNFRNSQNDLKVENVGSSQIQFTKIQNSFYDNNILSNFYLEKSLTYKVVFETLYEYSNQFYYFVGLTSCGNEREAYYDNLSFSILSFDDNNIFGVNTPLKGDRTSLRNKFKKFEFTVNISLGILEVSDYPDRNNIISIDKNRIADLQSKEKLQFVFSIYHENTKLLINSISKSNS